MDVSAFDYTLFPGVSVIGPGFGLPLAVLWALLDEPFYAQAGVGPNSVRTALRANLVAYVCSWAIALPASCLISGHGENGNLFTMAAGVATPILIYSKYYYLRTRTPMRNTGLKWVIAGQALGVVVGGLVFFSLPLLRAARPRWAHDLYDWRWTLYLVSAVPAAIIFLGACVGPLKKKG